MKRLAAAFACGLLFAAGLGLSGMTQPAKVLAFLDVAGAWDPALMFVMGGAIPVAAIGFWLGRRRGTPLFDAKLHLPARASIDRTLVAGAVVFGVGWGLSGWCPGPAIASVVTGSTPALVFVGCMLAGMAVVQWVNPEVRAREAGRG